MRTINKLHFFYLFVFVWAGLTIQCSQDGGSVGNGLSSTYYSTEGDFSVEISGSVQVKSSAGVVIFSDPSVTGEKLTVSINAVSVADCSSGLAFLRSKTDFGWQEGEGDVGSSSALVVHTKYNTHDTTVYEAYALNLKKCDINYITLSHPTLTQSSLFASFFSYSVPFVSEIVLADLDADGHQDLVSAHDGGVAFILYGLGDGSFEAPVQMDSISETSGLIVQDFNNDGKKDILKLTKSTGQTARLYLNSGSRTYSSTVTTIPAGVSVGSGDVTGDGFIDVLMFDSSKNTYSVYKNNDARTFDHFFSHTARTDIAVNTPVPGAVADLNGDGRLDLIVLENGNVPVKLLNPSNQGFASSVIIDSQISYVRKVLVGQLNSGAEADVLFSGVVRSGSYAHGVIYYDGASNTPPAPVVMGAGISEVVMDTVLADADGDGDLDIIQAEKTSGNRIWFNNNNDLDFVQGNVMLSSTQNSYGIAAAQLNGTGLVDFVFSGFNAQVSSSLKYAHGQVYVYKQ